MIILFTHKLYEQSSSRGLRETPKFCFLRPKNRVSSNYLILHFSLVEKIYVPGDEACFRSASAVSRSDETLKFLISSGIFSLRILSETRVLFYFATLPVQLKTQRDLRLKIELAPTIRESFSLVGDAFNTDCTVNSMVVHESNLSTALC